MPRRLTSKQEAFAALVAAGKTAVDAYKTAYAAEAMKPASVEKESKRLLNNPLIAPRIRDLQSKAVESTRKVIEVNLEQALFENAAIAFSDVNDLFDDDGHLRHPKDMARSTRAAIASIKTRRIDLGDSKGALVVNEIKFWDKGAAIDRFFKHFGAYEKDNRQKAGGFLDALPREVAKAIVDRLKALSGPVVG